MVALFYGIISLYTKLYTFVSVLACEMIMQDLLPSKSNLFSSLDYVKNTSE